MSDATKTSAEGIEPYYQRQAQEMVDTLYDKEFLDQRVSREAMRGLEDYIGFVMQSQVESAVKASELLLISRNLRETAPHPAPAAPAAPKAARPIVMLKDQMRRWFDLPDDAPSMTFTQFIKMAEGNIHDRGGREFAAQFAEKLAYIVDSAVT